MSFAAKFNNLSPATRRVTLVAGALTIVLGVSWLLTSMTERKASRSPRAEKPEVTVVAPARTTGVEQFSAKMNVMEKNQEALTARLERVMKDLEEKSKRKPDGAPDAPSESAEPDLPVLDDKTSVFDAPAAKAPELPPPPPVMATPNAPGVTAPPPVAPEPTPVKKAIRLLGEGGDMDSAKAEEKLNKPEARTKKAGGNDSAFIPSGSMFTGVLLNGLDAPTSAVAQKNPTPVVVRVKREAVLPNYAAIDVRECFLMAAGYGQLSSERVMLRAESLSCVRQDGKVIESKIEAYIVGTDGKVGIPGRLVSKQGQLIAQSLLAGALGGIGQALNRSKVPSLNINPAADSDMYQTDSLSSIGQSGLAGGVGGATNMIAKFYLDMAKETFPVVEVPAGEVATVIVTRGATLPLKGSTNLQKYVDPNERPRGQTMTNRQQAADGPEEVPAAKPANPAGDRVTQALDMSRNTANAAVSAAKDAAGPNFNNGLGW